MSVKSVSAGRIFLLLFFFTAFVLFLFLILAGLRRFLNRSVPLAPPPGFSEEVQVEPDMEILLGFQTAEDLKGWRSHKYHGNTDYKIVEEADGLFLLRARSQASSSAILKEVPFEISKSPRLAWDWKVTDFPSGKKYDSLGSRSDNDFAVRVYAIFKGFTPLQSRVIQYVWDDFYPEGTQGVSAYTKQIKILVVRQGHSVSRDGWVHEERDLFADYEKLFGSRPKDALHGVGIMSDSDNTRSSSEAWIKNLRLIYPRAGTS